MGSKNLKNNKGGILLLTILVMFILSILGIALLNTSVSEAIFTKKSENNLKAHYYARSGVETMITYINNNKDMNKDDIETFLDNNAGVSSERTILDGTDNGFEVFIKKESNEEDKNIYSIASTGYHEGSKENLTVKIKEILPYDYAVFSNENLDVSGLEIEGPLGSNGSVTAPEDHNDDIYEYSEIEWESPIIPSPTAIYTFDSIDDFAYPNNTKLEINGKKTILTEETAFLNVTEGAVDEDGYLKLIPNYDDLFYIRDFDAVSLKIIFLTDLETETEILVDYFELGNNSQIEIDGDGYVTFFVKNTTNDPDVLINNGTTGFLDDPPKSNQLAMFIEDGATMEFASNATFNGFIYAPNVDVNYGSSSDTTVNGSIISNSFESADTNGGIIEIFPTTIDHPGLESYINMVLVHPCIKF